MTVMLSENSRCLLQSSYLLSPLFPIPASSSAILFAQAFQSVDGKEIRKVVPRVSAIRINSVVYKTVKQ